MLERNQKFALIMALVVGVMLVLIFFTPLHKLLKFFFGILAVLASVFGLLKLSERND